MAPIRVLVVDDAVVIRRLLSDILAADPAIEVAGVAANGRIALQKLEQVNPDLVILDVEMPELDGLATLAELRKRWRRLPVIMFSTLTERGAATTLEALALGATDYFTKPSNSGSMALAAQRVREELVPRIKQLCGRASAPAPGSAAPAPAAAVRPAPAAPRRVAPALPPEAVVIGVSTGGPNALAEVLPALPADFPVPVLVVQHMPPVFTRFLAERLDTRCKLRVVEATAGMPVQAGTIYVAPGDWHMVAERGGALTPPRIRLHQGPLENSCRPAVDPLFRSAVECWGGALLGVVLTGMGQDGLRGAEAIHDAGGQVLAQDEATSVVWGMPGFVANSGFADRVLPLGEVAGEIVRRAAVPARGGR